ncbi:NAD(P)/FAD-dependent oxidoreductase [Venatoribacter cucullus]|uniref:NAD(P)/FAD-dependent oxidoreductase n=1 Tax=Venatoribacter cucullus TaxID=2661630 RepID=UPI00223F7F73|nr:FAD/NAD(P)-binding oxidoreductase [Venatoribacter cucullus]UZK04727.1 pyridine nucleotide-disulfide oxidoreductase [Venatoribacter cucullus]
MSVQKHSVVIVGGGTAGISVAAKLRRTQPELDVAIVEPAQFHYYQPAWTLVGGGTYKAEATQRPFSSVLPAGVTHIAQAVAEVRADDNQLLLGNGDVIGYDQLVLAAGIQINWAAIKGLPETLGKNGVTSNYRYDLAPYTWELVQQFKGGTAIFTQPAGAVKCPGAPQKALYLSADYWRQQGVQVNSLQFRTGAPAVFGVPFYAKALNQIMASYEADARFTQTLVEVRGEEKIAVFETSKDGEKVREEVAFDLLHVVPPQSAPDFIRTSALANAEGWLDVNQQTLRHARYANVFGLGDCTSTPNSKTAAAIKSQVPVLVANLLSARAQQELAAQYDGYAACPLTTSRNKVLLAEFTYGGVISTTLPLDSRIPRRFYGWLKRSFLPWFYWNLLLKGRNLRETHQKREFAEQLPKAVKA